MPNDLSKDIKRVIKRLLPTFLKDFIKYMSNTIKCWCYIRGFRHKITAIHKNEGNAIIIMATPVHGNLGDHAIVYAEKYLLRDLGFEKRIIEVAGPDYALCKNNLRKCISNQDLIIIDGGGNLGILWPWEDDKLSEIISSYRHNPIIIFPQTCYYDESLEAQKRLKRNKSVYSNADRLLITLRDEKSYRFCCSHFNAHQFLLVPDIVLYLYGKINMPIMSARTGVLLCFRKDLERVISQVDKEILKVYLKQQKISCKEISTVQDYGINRFSRQDQLNKIWYEFVSASLVITDRLHGMIFAAINGTPCLALDNVSKKVSGVYELISQLGFIKICSSVDDVIKNAPLFYAMNPSLLEFNFGEANYQQLKNYLIESIKE